MPSTALATTLCKPSASSTDFAEALRMTLDENFRSIQPSSRTKTLGLLMVQKSGEPVEVASLSHYLQGFFTSQVVSRISQELCHQGPLVRFHSWLVDRDLYNRYYKPCIDGYRWVVVSPLYTANHQAELVAADKNTERNRFNDHGQFKGCHPSQDRALIQGLWRDHGG